MIRRLGWTLLAVLAGLAALVWMINFWGGGRIHDEPPTAPPSAERVARGAYLARVGDCMLCHTARGGAPFAGGRAIATPFGTVYSSNLTPDAATGLGRWSAAHFRRALHQGRSRDGRLLYPVFPYPHTTRVTDADADLLFDYLQGLGIDAGTELAADYHGAGGRSRLKFEADDAPLPAPRPPRRERALPARQARHLEG